MINDKNEKIWTVLGIALLVFTGYILFRHSYFITDLLKKSGPLAPAVALLLYPLLALTPVPTEPITLAMSFAYGPLFACAIATCGNTFSALVEYYFGLKLGKKLIPDNEKKKIPFGLGKLPVNSIVFLTFGRLIPGYGSKIISLVAGRYHVPVRRYVWTSILISFLGAAALSFGGLSLIQIHR